jgi:hypothetical protein
MQLARLLSALADAQVGVILIGGVAARAHGASRFTQDIDFAYARDDTNLERLATALAPAAPYLRGAPPGLPFEWSVATLRRGLNFTLTTSWGDVDLFGEIPGGGGYEELLPHSEEVTAFGRPVRLLSLDWLIHVKRAAGRPKDLEVLAELEVIRDERDS